MDMKEIDRILMGNVKGLPASMDYARGVGKATAIIWGMLYGMEPEKRAKMEAILRKSIEEETVNQ